MFAAMRYIILFFICLSAIGAETTNKLSSLDSFAKQIRTSYEKKDGAWMLQSSYTNGVPAEILAANEKMFRSFWGIGGLQVKSVQTFTASDYEAIASPGDLNGKALRHLPKPTHWVVLRAESPNGANPKTTVELEFPVFQKDGQWKIVGATYAD